MGLYCQATVEAVKSGKEAKGRHEQAYRSIIIPQICGNVGACSPEGVAIQEVLESSEPYKGRFIAVNVIDQQGAVMRLGLLAVCYLLEDMEIEPVFQTRRRDRNHIIAIQSDLLGAYVLGIKNVLCLTGHYVTSDDHPQAKPVFDLDSVSLLQAAVQLQQGRDLAEKELQGFPSSSWVLQLRLALIL